MSEIESFPQKTNLKPLRMFGRVRASSSSVSSLEMERPPPKIIKYDSLSIYESTLLKLKQGSHCNPRINPEDSNKVDASCVMAIDSPQEAMTADADHSSTDSLPNSSSSTGNMSILHFFSKCKSSKQCSSSDEEVMVNERGYSSSSSVSSTSSS